MHLSLWNIICKRQAWACAASTLSSFEWRPASPLVEQMCSAEKLTCELGKKGLFRQSVPISSKIYEQPFTKLSLSVQTFHVRLHAAIHDATSEGRKTKRKLCCQCFYKHDNSRKNAAMTYMGTVFFAWCGWSTDYFSVTTQTWLQQARERGSWRTRDTDWLIGFNGPQ